MIARVVHLHISGFLLMARGCANYEYIMVGRGQYSAFGCDHTASYYYANSSQGTESLVASVVDVSKDLSFNTSLISCTPATRILLNDAGCLDSNVWRLRHRVLFGCV